jgi:hypothetical protein
MLRSKKESVRMTSPENIVNGMRVQREVTVVFKKVDWNDFP